LTNDSGFITSGSYLPLSGGILSTSSTGDVLHVNSSYSGDWSCICYKSKNSFNWSVGCNASCFYFYNGNKNAIVTSIDNDGNVSSSGKFTNTAGAGSAFRWGGSSAPHYVGNNGTEAYFYSGNSLGLGLATGGSWRLYITSGGSVGIATTSPPSGYKLYVNGSAGGSSPWGNASDMKLKNVVGDVDTTFE